MSDMLHTMTAEELRAYGDARAAEARREALESVEALLLSQGGWPAAELIERVRALAEPPKEG